MMKELFAACKMKKEKLIVDGAGHGDAMEQTGKNIGITF